MSESRTPELPFPSAEPQPPSEPGERWLPVVGYPNYMVSDFGRVWSRPRTKSRGGIMKHHIDPIGRHGVMMTGPGGKQKYRRVHQLVAEAFLPPRPDGQEIRHLDDNKDNNRLTNLEYGTHRENGQDAKANGVTGNGRKTHCKYGHEYTPENTRVGKSGSRFCIQCRRDRAVRDRLAREVARAARRKGDAGRAA